jgi:hypothetical protein
VSANYSLAVRDECDVARAAQASGNGFIIIKREKHMAVKKYLKESIKLGGLDFTVETGKVAKQADGSVIVRYGDTMVLVTAVGAQSPREGIDFFPLTVEYREARRASERERDAHLPLD